MVAPSAVTINLCGGSMVLLHDSFVCVPKWLTMLNIFHILICHLLILFANVQIICWLLVVVIWLVGF